MTLSTAIRGNVIDHLHDDFAEAVQHLINRRRHRTEYTDDEVPEIVGAYVYYGLSLDVNWQWAFSQACHETNSFVSFWSTYPNYNPAGLGVTGETAPAAIQPRSPDWAFDHRVNMWRRGLSFETRRDGIYAHFGRLLAYTNPLANGMTPAQADAVFKSLSRRHLPEGFKAVRTWDDLSGLWAKDLDYAKNINRERMVVFGDIVGFSKDVLDK